MKAIFEVNFSKKSMCEQKDVDEEYGGSWLKLMKYLYKSDGFGIFKNEPKLIDIKEKNENK